MPGPTGSQVRPLSWLRKRPAPAVPQYTRGGSRGSTATQSGDRPPKCSSTVQVEARRAIHRAARVTTTMLTMTQCARVVSFAQYHVACSAMFFRHNRVGDMELRHLRYFVAVCEALNFTKAAAQRRIAQPALSRQVQE